MRPPSLKELKPEAVCPSTPLLLALGVRHADQLNVVGLFDMHCLFAHVSLRNTPTQMPKIGANCAWVNLTSRFISFASS